MKDWVCAATCSCTLSLGHPPLPPLSRHTPSHVCIPEVTVPWHAYCIDNNSLVVVNVCYPPVASGSTSGATASSTCGGDTNYPCKTLVTFSLLQRRL